MTIYEQFWEDRRRHAELATAMAQPLDVAVLAIQRHPRTPIANRLTHTNYLRRWEDDSVTLPILEPACLGHGS